MFALLEKWLTNQLGDYIDSELSLSNVGEKFKDGVLFARLLHKYGAIPDRDVYALRRTRFYAPSLINVKKLNVWLKPLDIAIDECVVQDIARGQPFAVTRLLFRLYFKLEAVNRHQICVYDPGAFERLASVDDVDDRCTSVSPNSTDDDDDDDDEDYLKSAYRSRSTMGLARHDTDCLYNAFSNCANDGERWLKDEFADTESDYETCDMILDDISRVKSRLPTTTDADPTNNTVNPETNPSTAVSVSGGRRQFSDVDRFEYPTEEKRERDERLARQEQLLDEYLERTGPWNSVRLNVPDAREGNARHLSTVVNEVLNFAYGISEIKPIAVRQTRVAGVVDKIQNKKVVQLIVESLGNRGILGFTADDALAACVNAYKVETDGFKSDDKLYRDSEQDDYYNGRDATKIRTVSDTIRSDFDEMIENETRTSVSYLTVNAEETESSGTPRLKYVHKYTQTQAQVSAYGLDGSGVADLSPMANLGKLIDDKHRQNYDLQIGDVINCVGEFVKENATSDAGGWVLLEFPNQPLQMALLEYKLTGMVPPYGRDICKSNARTSRIVAAYGEHDGDNEPAAGTGVSLSHCVKITRHNDEMKNEKWNEFFDYYKGRMHVCRIHPSYVRKHARKAADTIVGIMLDDGNGHKPRKIFKQINVFSDDKSHTDDSDESDIGTNFTSRQLTSNPSSVIGTEDKNGLATAMNATANQFRLVASGSGPNKAHNSTDYAYTAYYLRDTWDAMESGYLGRIKELLDAKDALFKELKARDDAVASATGRAHRAGNPRLAELVDEYDADGLMFRLQCRLWDHVDAEWERTTRYIGDALEQPRTTVECTGTLTGIYEQLLDTELTRAVTTVNVLNRYYDGDADELAAGMADDGRGDPRASRVATFQTFCSDVASGFESRVRANRKVQDDGEEPAWTGALTEINRLANQATRIGASWFADKAALNDLSAADGRLETARAVHRSKTNDVNNVCKLLERARRTSTGRALVEQISGRFAVNGWIVFEAVCNRTFRDTGDNFSADRLKTMVDRLLADYPAYRTPADALVDAFNGTRETAYSDVYPKRWPRNDRFRERFARKLLGDNATTAVDWRDLVVQCAELPCPSTDQLLSCREQFAARDTDGDETVTDDVFDAIRLWFEDGSSRTVAMKRLLGDVYRGPDNRRVHYGALLLAFCRDERPWMGLAKAFALLFGRDPSDPKHTLTDRPPGDDLWPQWRYESDGGHFVFDATAMAWLLNTSLGPYLDRGRGKPHGNHVDVARIVQSVFARVGTARTEPAIIDLFRNSVMDEALYGAVYKFHARKLSDVAMSVVIEHDVCVEL